MIHLILKEFLPVVLDLHLVLRKFHYLLPKPLKFQDNFGAAIAPLKGPLSQYHSKPDARSQQLLRDEATERIHPVVSVKIGRPDFRKAWVSIRVDKSFFVDQSYSPGKTALTCSATEIGL